MKFGVVFPAYGPYCYKKFAREAAIGAESGDIDSMLVWDHYMLPYGKRTFDAYILLSYLASETDRIKLGTCVTPLPFRNPAILAKMIATLDVLSNGRIIAGVGAGWSREEFEGYSKWDDAGTRVRKAEEALNLMTRLWTEERVTFEGEFYSTKEAVLEPKPTQDPHPPLWFGTAGEVMLQLAAKYGDGWIPIDISVGEYRKCAATLRDHPLFKESFVFSFVDWPKSQEDLAARIEELKEAGCDYYCTILHRVREKTLKQIEILSELKDTF